MLLLSNVALWSFLFLADSTTASSGDPRPWIRYPAISPGGESIAFCTQGDLWIVNANGGVARRLTNNPGYERSPVWSPDGSTLAFAADWYGNFDVFVIADDGGEAQRLTFHSTGGTPGRLDAHLPGDIPTGFTPDGEHVLFASRRHDFPEARLGNSSFGELLSIPVRGGRPRTLLTVPAHSASMRSDGGAIVFHDYKGYEDPFRKHHTSSSTRDLWIYETETQAFRKLTGFPGDDREPRWSPKEQWVYFLSEQKEPMPPETAAALSPPSVDRDPRLAPRLQSSFNVWRVDPDTPERQEQITFHRQHPVRFLSVSRTGTLCYGFHGSVFLDDGRPETPPKPVTIQLPRAPHAPAIDVPVQVSEFAVRPDETEVAVIARGEILVANLETGTTQRLTRTPGQERGLSWSGKHLYYASERGRSWNLYRRSPSSGGMLSVSEASLEEPILESEDDTDSPLCSPDGQRLAYYHHGDELRVLDLKTRAQRIVVPGSMNYSDQDGALRAVWSPDSQWLAFPYLGHSSGVPEVGIVHVESGEITNLTESGYSDGSPRFSRNGGAVLYSTERFGRRNHGGFGAQRDVVALFLNQESAELGWTAPSQSSLRKRHGDTEVETEGLHWRRQRVTAFSSDLSDYEISADHRSLLCSARATDQWALWRHDLREGGSERLLSLAGPAQIELGEVTGRPYLLQGGEVFRTRLESDDGSLSPVSLPTELAIDESAERRAIFDHLWSVVRRKFYDPDLHQVNWDQMGESYRAFLPSITNGYDFCDLVSELVGELNCSHLGCRFEPTRPAGDETAALGLLFDPHHDGPGLRIAEVLAGGPADRSDSGLWAGLTVTHLDGVELGPSVNHWQLLNRKNKQSFRLQVSNPSSQASWEETVESISVREENRLLYERWVERCRRDCEELSDGRIGYVHIQWMSDSGFRRVYSEVLGRHHEKEALVLDTRFNGGGWLHDDLVTFLGGNQYTTYVGRNHPPGFLGNDPMSKWTKPVVVLQNEGNYSNGHSFPRAFHANALGKLVGAPVPGTSTTVWIENQVNPDIVSSVAQIGFLDQNGQFLENQQLEPDVLVLNSPEEITRGEDPQLETAVSLLLEELDE